MLHGKQQRISYLQPRASGPCLVLVNPLAQHLYQVTVAAVPEADDVGSHGKYSGTSPLQCPALGF